MYLDVFSPIAKVRHEHDNESSTEGPRQWGKHSGFSRPYSVIQAGFKLKTAVLLPQPPEELTRSPSLGCFRTEVLVGVEGFCKGNVQTRVEKEPGRGGQTGTLSPSQRGIKLCSLSSVP